MQQGYHCGALHVPQVEEILEGIMGWVDSLATEHEALFDWSAHSEEHFGDSVALSIGEATLPPMELSSAYHIINRKG